MSAPSPSSRDAAITAWVTALRAGADAAALRALPELTPDESARVVEAMRGAVPPAEVSRSAEGPRFRPRLTLQTLGRGEGLLGMRPSGPFGPRGTAVTVAFVDWVYTLPSGAVVEVPAPTSVLNSRAPARMSTTDTEGRAVTLHRDARAEAPHLVHRVGLHPLDASTLQWRDT